MGCHVRDSDTRHANLQSDSTRKDRLGAAQSAFFRTVAQDSAPNGCTAWSNTKSMAGACCRTERWRARAIRRALCKRPASAVFTAQESLGVRSIRDAELLGIPFNSLSRSVRHVSQMSRFGQ